MWDGLLGSHEAVLHKYSEGWVGDAAVQEVEQHIASMSMVWRLAQGLGSSVDLLPYLFGEEFTVWLQTCVRPAPLMYTKTEQNTRSHPQLLPPECPDASALQLFLHTHSTAQHNSQQQWQSEQRADVLGGWAWATTEPW